jgi:glycosyltransferase involved in cell wall biosynthesis
LNKITVTFDLINCTPDKGGIFQYALSLIKDFNDYYGDEFNFRLIASSREVAEIFNQICVGQVVEQKEQNLIKAKRLLYIASNFGLIPKSYGEYDYIKKLGSIEKGILISFNQRPDGFYFNVPSITAIHDSPRQWNHDARKTHSFGYWLQFESECYRVSKQPGYVLCDSEQSKREFSRLYGKNEVVYLPFRPLLNFKRNCDEAIRFKYKLDAEYLYYPSTTHPVKNHKRLIQAIALFNSINPQKKLQLILSGPKDGFTDHILKYGLQQKILIQHIGYVDQKDMSGIYSNSAALVMPSLFDFMNIPSLEALACGCPVILSCYESLKSHFGPLGIYVNPLSVESICDGIQKAVFDKVHMTMLIEQGPLFIDKSHSSKTRSKILKELVVKLFYDWNDS